MNQSSPSGAFPASPGRRPERTDSMRPASVGRGRADVYINGRFLTQKESGVQRFSLQLVRALDTRLSGGGRRWTLLVPPGARAVDLQHIAVREVGKGQGHGWDQLLRFHVGRGDLLVNLANSGPILRGRSLSVIHDAAVFRTPANFTRGYRTYHRLLGRLIAIRSRIATVSRFSRDELAIALGVEAHRIDVIPNSSEHLLAVSPDSSVLKELSLTPGEYFLAIGSPVANKNLARAIEAFRSLGEPDRRFVIVGSVDRAVFGASFERIPPGVVMAGGLSDAKMAALIREARALVFPSLYEGFGIPPLEAMQYGCPVLASDIPPVREVCADAAVFFDPLDIVSIAAAMRRSIDEPSLRADLARRGSERVQHYSWSASAELLQSAVDRLD